MLNNILAQHLIGCSSEVELGEEEACGEVALDEVVPQLPVNLHLHTETSETCSINPQGT